MKKIYALSFLLVLLTCYLISLNSPKKSLSLPALEIPSELLPEEKDNIRIFHSGVQAVVHVTNIQLARNFFETYEVPAGSGSGFIWDDQGHIVTNFHVVKGGKSFSISFQNDPNQYEAVLIGTAPRKDIAVLKLKDYPNELKPLTHGQSKDLLVGQKAIAIGNPFGLDYTMTTGIVSALNRQIATEEGIKIHGMIQTDASINPGNSGGPLLNSSGSLIGMNTAIYSNSGSSAGIGFAVPIDTIAKIVPQLIQYGKEIHPSIGVVLIPENYNRRLNLSQGLMINRVIPGSPAEKAQLLGVQQKQNGYIIYGDVILGVNNDKINSIDDLYHILGKYRIGDEVTLQILRNKRQYRIQIKLYSPDI